jgi:hypothetical protein
MKYKKRIEWSIFNPGGDFTFRLDFRTVFVGQNTNPPWDMGVPGIAYDINTGSTPRYLIEWCPKKIVRRNYKNIFRTYTYWHGVDE